MSIHYGQRVEVWNDGKWRPGTTDRSDGWIRVVLDEGHVVWAAPFHIRPLKPGDEAVWDNSPLRDRDPKGDS